ncbi:unnamed protein product [Orchesella dallaii]|uniref:AB hydrolase-1 domain-containing protein n=1 Tax=Orchesella dallaii TaxID=48710 RepID=A0ABP1QJN5_9HEXA
MDDLDNLSEEAKQPLVTAYGDEYLQEIWAGLNQSYTDISAAGGHICRNEAKQITCPTLILHGADDKTMPRAHAMWFKNHIANAEYVAIPAAGHALHLQFPEFFVSVVLQFLEGV